MSISTRLMILLMSIVIIPMLFVGSITYVSARNALEQATLSGLHARSEFMERTLFLYLDKLRAQTVDFTSDGYIRDSVSALIGQDTNERVEGLNAHLLDKQTSVGENIVRIDVLDTNGEIVASTHPQEIGAHKHEEQYFVNGQKDSYVVDAHEEADGRIVMNVAAPLRDRVDPTNVIGVLVNYYDVILLNELFTGEATLQMGARTQATRMGETDETYLVNQEGLMVTSSLFIKDAIFNQTVETYPVRKGLQDDEEVSGIWLDYRGIPVIGSSMVIEVWDFTWVLLSEQDVAEAFAPIYDLRRLLIVSGVIVSFLVAVVALSVSQSISKPIRALHKGTEAVEGGDLDYKVGTSEKDEIGQLSRSFDRMVGHVKKRNVELEVEIAERRKAETELTVSEHNLNRAQEVAHVGSWCLDLATHELAWTEENHRIFGILAGTPLTYERVLDIVHPDDRAYVDKKRKAVVNTGAYDIEHRIIVGENVKWVRDKAEVECDEEGRPVRAIGTTQDITDRKRGELELTRVSAIVEGTTDFVGIADPQGQVLYVNRGGRRMIGADEDEDLSRTTLAEYHPKWAVDLFAREAFPTAMRTGAWSGEAALVHRDGHEIPVSQVIMIHRAPDGTEQFRATISRDITERTKLETQLRQAQKMEAVGQLAGGVAHDFNNVLAAIQGCAGFLLDRFPPGDAARQDVEEIQVAAERAAALTRRLLAFGRQQVLNLEVLDLNGVITDLDRMLQRVISEDIALVTVAADEPVHVKADRTQLEQVIVNLAVNARDAMPGGGQLTIEAAPLTLGEDYCRTHVDARPGRYVMLAVTDTGTGMDKQTQERMFEPFFSTKASGQGSGLGLATVHGIVKQSGGSLSCYSELGRGTTFKVYLPRVDEAAPAVSARPPAVIEAATGTETILLVEDEDAVRRVARRMLERAGHTIVEVAHSRDAVQVCERHGGPIHLLLTDVVMPDLSGPELAARLRQAYPDLRVMYMSGYATAALTHNGVVDENTIFVPKPFTSDVLLSKVRQALDTPVAG